MTSDVAKIAQLEERMNDKEGENLGKGVRTRMALELS